MAELEGIPGAILFIDEMHTVIGAGATSGGAMDASNLLKPALASGTLRCIGSSTYKEYRSYIEKDRALLRRFQKIDVNEPSIADTVRILRGLKPYYERHHHIRYTDAPLRAAVELASKYINDRKLPDKAIDVIDEVGAAEMLKPESRRRKTIGGKEIEGIVGKRGGGPGGGGLGPGTAHRGALGYYEAAGHGAEGHRKAHRLLSVLRPHGGRQD